MKNYSIKNADRVRVISPSYMELAKGDYHYPNYWRESTGSDDNEIMLGGEYIVLDIVGNHALLLNDNENNKGLIPLSWLIQSVDLNSCIYKIGDQLKFSPECSPQDIAYLSGFSAYNLEDSDIAFTVTYILNNYYIFLDYQLDNVHAFPFRWEDFTLKSRKSKQ